MDTSLLPIDAPLPVQSFEYSLFAFQPYLVPKSRLSALRILRASHSTCPFTASRTLPPRNLSATPNLLRHELGSPESEPKVTWPSFGQDFTSRTSTPFSSSSSCSGSQDNSGWDSGSSTDTSLPSLSGNVFQAVDFETGQVCHSSWSTPSAGRMVDFSGGVGLEHFYVIDISSSTELPQRPVLS
jgi:hypothetical protein